MSHSSSNGIKCHILIVLSMVIGISIQFSDSSSISNRDIDLQTCIDNFALHRDKIIRTQDSQHMGAQYLNEIDLGTREECLRLCCETTNCDVFVFEEKKSGSCYLFHCGPPEDFKCKFTHHVNYSSGILAVNRHLSSDLESQIKLTKHEQDLTKLRKSDLMEPVAGGVAPPQSPPSSTTATTIKSREILPLSSSELRTKPPESEENRKCSRYQFECRSTSECIAIYNACDGIPQCADGSDEAPELECPSSSETYTTQFPSVAVPQPRFKQQQQQPARYEPNNVVATSSRILHPFNRQPEIYNQPQIPPQQQHPEADFLRPPVIPVGLGNNNRQFEQIPQYGPQNNGWVPHQSNQMPQYQDKNSHIFNHKESGLQVPDGQEISQIQSQYGDANARDYQKIQNYYEPANYRQQVLSNPQEIDQYRYQPQEPPMQPQLVEPKKETPAIYTKTIIREDLQTKENPKHEQEKMASELKNSKDVVSQPKIKIEKIYKHPHNTHRDQLYPDVVAYKIDENSELNDGFAETPGGAVLSLTLGLIITCILALLIACRLKVKRRMRKGEKSYAHDADYLVNGMYL